ncbi:MAG: NAD(P)H-hydrate dehydratase [Pseudomonadota bacterium]|nr:NAD(P)H-hydrate dehydratase [Pseudomonadota bacterium]
MTSDSIKQYTSELPAALYRAAQVRELDRIAIEEHGIPGFELMSRAGQAAFDLLRDRWPQARRLCVFCGVGNNGGDGYVIAALAEKAGFEAHVVQVGASDRIQGDALTAWQRAEAEGASFEAFDPQGGNEEGSAGMYHGDVIVDALLGTGLSGDVRGDYQAAIDAINRSGCPVLAVDIPSGLCADTGRVLGRAVVADCSISFIGLKQGLLSGQAPDFVGDLYFASLDVPAQVQSALSPSSALIGAAQIRRWLPPRSRLSHKGNHGHVLVIGGDLGMGGAAVMAAEAAGRAGAGLISVVTRPEHISAVLGRRPECMVLGVGADSPDIRSSLEKADVLVVGPGIGQHTWGQSLLKQALATELPMVLDADGLNLLASWQQDLQLARRGNWVLTPHPGEAARLLGISTEEVAWDRFATVQRLQQQFGGAVVLKGAGSLVAAAPGTESGEENAALWVCRSGNPGMATGGMGDVLSGVIGGLLAQGLNLEQAAAAGVQIHATAGDRAVEQAGQRGLLATDLMPYIRRLVNPR